MLYENDTLIKQRTTKRSDSSISNDVLMSIPRLNESFLIIPEPADEAHTRIFGTDSLPIHAPLSLAPPPAAPFFVSYFIKVYVFGNIFQARTLKSEAGGNLLEREIPDSEDLKGETDLTEVKKE